MIRRTFSYHYKPFVVNLCRKKYILLLVAMTTFYLNLIFFSMQNLFSCRSHSMECGVCIRDIFNTCFLDLTEGVNIWACAIPNGGYNGIIRHGLIHMPDGELNTWHHYTKSVISGRSLLSVWIPITLSLDACWKMDSEKQRIFLVEKLALPLRSAICTSLTKQIAMEIPAVYPSLLR